MRRALVVIGTALALVAGPVARAQAGEPLVSAAPVSVAENVASGKAIVTLKLDQPATQRIDVAWSTVNGTAVAGADYTAASGTAAFLVGQRTKTVPVVLRNDVLDEAAERFRVRLSSDDAALSTTSVAVTINDDDAMPTVAAGRLTTAEGARGTTKKVSVPVTLSRRSGRDVKVTWQVATATAVAGVDAKGGPALITIPAGQLSVTVPVVVVGDNVAEGDEAAVVKLMSPVNTTVARHGRVTITDDDDPATSTDLQVQLATAKARTRTFATLADDKHTILGGSMTTTGPDGTAYTLTIPHGALAEPTTITMTPWQDVEGISAAGGTMLGVDLKPNGLTLLDGARLRIVPPSGNPRSVESFAYAGAGRGAHRYPLDPDPTRFGIEVYHFSGYGGMAGNEVTTPVPPADPTGAQQKLASEIAKILAAERERALDGLDPSDDWGSKIETLMKNFYDAQVGPRLKGIREDCAQAKRYNAFVLGWARQAALLFKGGEGALAAEQQAVLQSVATGSSNCLEKAMQPCVDKNNATQMKEIMYWWRHSSLMGAPTPDPPPLDPSRECGLLTGTIAIRYQKVFQANGFRTEEDYTVTLTPFLKDHGGYWLDNGHGTWSMTGGSTRYDQRPDAPCGTMYEYVYSGNGMMYAGSHPQSLDPETEPGLGKVELEGFYRQYDFGTTPQMRVEVVPTNTATSYYSTSEGCDSNTQDRHWLQHVPGCDIPTIDLVGTVVTDPVKGKGVRFTCSNSLDNSAGDTIDTQQVDITGTLWPNG